MLRSIITPTASALARHYCRRAFLPSALVGSSSSSSNGTAGLWKNQNGTTTAATFATTSTPRPATLLLIPSSVSTPHSTPERLSHFQQSPSSSSQHSYYHSRAHPKPISEYAITTALDSVLADIDFRRQKRQRKWDKHGPTSTLNGTATDTSSDDSKKKDDDDSSATAAASPAKQKQHPDETIELCLNLNLDPRKQGQALRGSLELPHGLGVSAKSESSSAVVVLTADESVAEAALAAGAAHAGGLAIVEQLTAGDIGLDNIATILATPDIMPQINSNKKYATLPRLLGPRGLYPNAKVGTLAADATELLATLSTRLAGKQVTYRAESQGIVHVPVGKASLGALKLLDNIAAVMNALFEAKPESYGKGKKVPSKNKKKGASTAKAKTKAAKYLLKASISSTQGKGWRLDARTVDPGSAFFLTSGEEGSENSSSSSSNDDDLPEDQAA